jgi:purine-binding chemotaxis protein CheW
LNDLTSTNSRFLVISIGKEEYAIPLLNVREVIAYPEITPTPHSPAHFLGIMNLRGQVISIVDLRLKFGIKSANSEETTVVILDLEDGALGIVVDSVNSVLTAAQSQLSEPPEMESTKNSEYITSVYRKEASLILVLDIARSLSKMERGAMKAATAAMAPAA